MSRLAQNKVQNDWGNAWDPIGGFRISYLRIVGGVAALDGETEQPSTIGARPPIWPQRPLPQNSGRVFSGGRFGIL